MRRFAALRTLAVVAALVASFITSAWAGETERPIEYLFPQSTLVGLALPDLSAARTAMSASRLGEIYNQPEMHAFLDPVCKEMSAAYDKLRAANPAVPTLDVLDRSLLNGELAVSLYSRGFGQEPGLFISIQPKDAKAFEELLKPALRGNPLVPDQPVPLEEGDGAPGVIYTHGRLLFCKPMSDLVEIATRAADKAEDHQGSLWGAAGFKAAQKNTKSSAAWLYVNPPELLDLAAQAAKAKGEKVDLKALFDTLGLGSLNALLLNLDFSGREAVCDVVLGKQGDTGIFSLFNARGVKKDALKIASLDAPYVSAGSFNFSEVMPLIRKAVATAAPGQEGQLDNGLKQIAAWMKIDIEKDLLENIEPDFAMAQTPLDTTLPLSFQPGMVALFHLKNGAKMTSSLEKVFAVALVLGAPQLPPIVLKVGTTNYKGTKIYYFSQLLNGAHAFAVSKDNLIYGTSVNAVKRGIDQLAATSTILDNKDFQTAIARVSGQPFDAEKLPSSFSYAVDRGSGGGTLVVTALGIAEVTAILAGSAEGLAKGQLLDQPALPPMIANLPNIGDIARHPAMGVAVPILNAIDLNIWPDESFFAQYRTAHAAISFADANGWHARSEFPPPMPQYGSMGALLPIAGAAIVASLVLPVIGRARGAAQHAASANNLKQIGLAYQMYINDNNAAPDSGASLFPKYIADKRVFQNPGHKDAAAGYTMIAGIQSSDQGAMVAYETEGQDGNRHVLMINGAVENLNEVEFQERLQATEAIVKKTGRQFKQVPLKADRGEVNAF